jgi:hypothetical protein
MRIILALTLLCCACEANDRRDAGNGTDATPRDAAPDAAPIDASASDASEIDGSTADASETTDAAIADAEPLDADAPDMGVPPDQLPPTDAVELLDWLQANTYAGWAAESAQHASTGPHFGDVRVFVNAALDASLGAGNTEHPVGSAAVKELFGNGNTIRGWSVMVKTEAGNDGSRWWWYERYDGSTYASSQGAGICVPCHADGVDSFRSPYPLQ